MSNLTASELRIGNYLVYTTSEGQELTGAIDWKSLKWLSEDPKGFNSTHKPIPLNEEILVKYGFERGDDGYVAWYQKEFPIIGVLASSESGEFIFDENTDTLRIMHLHQLQNLFFALTGKELEINL